MERNWQQSKTTIQIRQIVQIEDAYGIRFSPEMLAHLNVSAGENVQVVMTENDLVIRKVLPTNYPDMGSDGFQDVVNETAATCETTMKGE